MPPWSHRTSFGLRRGVAFNYRNGREERDPMKLNTLLLVSAFVGAVFGIAFVVVAGPLLSVYGVTTDKVGLLLAQLFGTTLLGFAVLNWLTRDVSDPDAQRAVVFANLTGDAIGFVIVLIGQLAGITNVVGWSTVAIYLAFVLAFGYVGIIRPRAA
jgi:hypothetical protein